ncbi:hypothetical protein C8J57DRAFT_1515559 [Mycena rebaudengoi]|nr:hypothetical protein C8J57DRAFT_1515559 [Mycena rebaudengoi]
MSQSGNATLAARVPENSLPSPSPSSSDLPDLPNPLPSTPKTLVATVCEILEHARTKKKSLTIDMYARCFKALDTLDTLLDAGDAVEASLKAFKLDLLAEINASALRMTYTTAAATPLLSSSPSSSSSANPSRPSAPPAPKTAAVKSWEVTILFDKESDILSLPLPEIKDRVEAAIAATGVEKLKGVMLRGVKILSRCRILVAVDSDRAASLLKQSAAHWVPKLTKNGSLVVPRCQIVVNGVPTSFNPSSPTAALDLYSRNCSAFRDPSKKASSLLVTISDALSTDLSIAKGLAVESTICYPHRYEEPPLSPARHVRAALAPTTLRVAPARRAQRNVQLTNDANTSPPRCANCKGKHPAYHKECPMRVKECELQSQRLLGRIFFNPSFDPSSVLHDDATTPFFFTTSTATPSTPPSPSQ